MKQANIQFLEYKAYQLRRLSLMATTAAGSGHVTSCLSAADIVSALFFHGMHWYDPCDVANPANDHFILSKGHAAPVLYAAWKEMGLLSEQELLTLRKFDSPLEGHPTARFPYAEAATGSLGQGLSIGLGIALSNTMDQRETYTYVLLGDSELAEGSVWEAVQLAAHKKAERLIAIVDCNRLGQANVTMEGHDVESYLLKFGAFGWSVLVVDGHNMQEIVAALDRARETNGYPTVIIAKTRKGHGLPANIEDKPGYHGKAFSAKELPKLLEHLEKTYSRVAKFQEPRNPHGSIRFACAKHSPRAGSMYHDKNVIKNSANQPARGECSEHCEECIEPCGLQKPISMPHPMYRIEEKIATRKAYGEALAILGTVAQEVVALDAEVKNSTFSEIFEHAFPKRFVECYIAEQNMVGMGVGFAHMGKMPFISTFGCFFTRAHDQIRQAAIGKAPLRLVGSHAGVSIGQDGPSQMALEDITMLAAVPGSVILYPCDAVSTYKLVECMANYRDGISYLRTTRSETPIVYDNCEEFKIGGLKVLEQHAQDQVCIVAAGITVFEARKAYEQLKQEGILCTIIDCYSIKPLDEASLKKYVFKAHKKLITVEDHYLQGGMGQLITYALRNEGFTIECLAVTKMPRSGTPEELRAYEGINADAIVAAVKNIVKK